MTGVLIKRDLDTEQREEHTGVVTSKPRRKAEEETVVVLRHPEW
jgi:hypothetical protein